MLFIMSSAGNSYAKEGNPYEVAYLRLTDGYWQAWVTDINGQQHKQVTSAAIDKTRLSWSKDKKELLCNRNDGTLVRANIESGKITPIKLSMQGTLDAQWSPDNQWIVFSHAAEASPDTNDLWLVRPNGQDLTKINNKPKLQLSPAWGSDGENIVYTSGTLNKYKIDIWKLNIKNGNKEQLTVDSALEFDPVLSPNGDVAYASNQSGNYDIWMIKQGTPRPVQITTSPAYEAQPSWSPDGKSIAYYALIDGQRRIWIRNIATGKAYAITPKDSPSRYPAWGR